MERYQISVLINSSFAGVISSPMLPRVSECIRWGGVYYRVNEIVYDYDDAYTERAVYIDVVPASLDRK